MPPAPRQQVTSALARYGQSLTAYHPTLRQRIAAALMGDHPSLAGENFVSGLLGTTGLGNTGFGLVDLTPIGAFLGAQEGVQNEDYTQAALSIVPGAKGTTDAAGAVERALLRGITPTKAYAPIPDIAPTSLRERYAYELYNASNGKDVNRINLTPERVQSAADQIIGRRDIKGRITNPYTFKAHSRDAIDFARAASRLGEKVSVKYPDGPTGSVYVRVGDRGTVRFADHPAPTDASGQVIGGFSKTMGRRHMPATMSVAPYDSSYEDALNWLAGGG